MTEDRQDTPPAAMLTIRDYEAILSGLVQRAMREGSQDELRAAIHKSWRWLEKEHRHRTGKAPASQEEMKAFFASSGTYVPLAFWKVSAADTYSIEQRGPFEGVEVRPGKGSKKRRFVVFWRNEFRKVRIPLDGWTPPESPNQWRLFVPGAPPRRLWDDPAGFHFLQDLLEEELRELRRVIQRNHPDKGGDRALYDEAIANLGAIREFLLRLG